MSIWVIWIVLDAHSKFPHVVTVLWQGSDDVVTLRSLTSGTSERLQNCVSLTPWFLYRGFSRDVITKNRHGIRHVGFFPAILLRVILHRKISNMAAMVVTTCAIECAQCRENPLYMVTMCYWIPSRCPCSDYVVAY